MTAKHIFLTLGDASSEKDPPPTDKIEDDTITDPIEELADNLSDIFDSAIEDSEEENQTEPVPTPPATFPVAAVLSPAQPKRQLSRKMTND